MTKNIPPTNDGPSNFLSFEVTGFGGQVCAMKQTAVCGFRHPCRSSHQAQPARWHELQSTSKVQESNPEVLDCEPQVCVNAQVVFEAFKHDPESSHQPHPLRTLQLQQSTRSSQN